ncbi:serotonin N-acetyltransferase 2, chloroplastic [Oryza brachyantha]|uniref:aralkylamine N-acetyltransferase n=1 Tax=Oryza brachyantha TaxID=4533 RepID=J3MPJ2_ORYBR|nr:serotonin N-acetyltransferase 2, chloroplastic [Oryza brachyantha]
MLTTRLQPRPRPRPLLRLRGGGNAVFTDSFKKKKSKAAVSCVAQVEVSVSDSELAARGFAVRRSTSGLDVGALNEVFARVGFPRRQEERLRRALEHSEVVWLEEAGRPVAFARAAGDGVFNAVVWDVVVEPSCQGLGLGRAVMERLVGELRAKGVSNIALYAEPRVVGFYRLLGFAMDPDAIRGMAFYRSRQQQNTTS